MQTAEDGVTTHVHHCMPVHPCRRPKEALPRLQPASCGASRVSPNYYNHLCTSSSLFPRCCRYCKPRPAAPDLHERVAPITACEPAHPYDQQTHPLRKTPPQYADKAHISRALLVADCKVPPLTAGALVQPTHPLGWWLCGERREEGTGASEPARFKKPSPSQPTTLACG